MTFKSRRFHDQHEELGASVTAGDIFLKITQPDAQIRQIARGCHDFFRAEARADEQISVSVMEWDEQGRHLRFLSYYPDEAPTASEAAFGDATTIAGLAYFTDKIVISEDLFSDDRYQKLGARQGGSMLAYPVYDDQRHIVALVVNVVSSRIRRFRVQDSEAVKIAMQVFGDRLLLEHRLMRLKRRI